MILAAELTQKEKRKLAGDESIVAIYRFIKIALKLKH